jgi:hypothetical protein
LTIAFRICGYPDREDAPGASQIQLTMEGQGKQKYHS